MTYYGRLLIFCLCIGPPLPLIWSAWQGSATPEPTPPPKTGLLTSPVSPFKAPEDEELKAMIADYRTKWTRVSGLQFSGMHWGQSVLVYINQKPEIYKHNHLTYLREFEEFDEDEEYEYTPYPVGTILLKENFLVNLAEKTQPLTQTIMIKREAGYDKEMGDWEYVQISQDGKLIVRGAGSRDAAVAAVCGNCHKNLSNRDYIFHTVGR
ncbi:cytochrome P460 family protein [Acanthopleuribacter pedis]|uniref:Cytochrome P460 family protein n=1 Tax=Acanthopleuribacter pedis TaxID=442870 RepID=A0A8J7Q7B1_9BACT|nr:cytochrome P460 family protein [Acanthopleuribacter pedis]MBO1319636.1 cytochrome P460 family protein [Acanthopleuribacter pedis]